MKIKSIKKLVLTMAIALSIGAMSIPACAVDRDTYNVRYIPYAPYSEQKEYDVVRVDICDDGYLAGITTHNGGNVYFSYTDKNSSLFYLNKNYFRKYASKNYFKMNVYACTNQFVSSFGYYEKMN